MYACVWCPSQESIALVYMGIAAQEWRDGKVSFVAAGVLPSAHTIKIEDAVADKVAPALHAFQINCTRPIHYVAHDHRIAIFCDGSFTATPQENSTVWFVKELDLPNAAAPVTRVGLQGSHHGVAVPINHDHMLISQPIPNRVNRVAGASSLPNGFEVYDSNMNLVRSLNNASDPNSNCVGYHGSGHLRNDFAFACDGETNAGNSSGILLVRYVPERNFYGSVKLGYPSLPGGYRTGTLVEDEGSPVFVGNLAMANQPSRLVSFTPNDRDDLSTNEHTQVLPAPQCNFDFELSAGHLVVVLLPTGRLQLYVPKPWTLVADVQAIPLALNATCAASVLAVGYAHAYVLFAGNVYAVDFSNVADIKVTTRAYGFNHARAAVSGVPDGYECPAPLMPDASAAPGAVPAWILLQNVPESTWMPGTASSTAFAQGIRRAVARALDVPIVRVFIGLMRAGPQPNTVVVRVHLMPRQARDVNQRSAEALRSQLQTELRNASSTLMAPGSALATADTSISVEAEIDDATTTASSSDDSSWNTGAKIAVGVIAGVAAVALVVGAVVFFKFRDVQAKYAKVALLQSQSQQNVNMASTA